jgi:hypothetical protein
MPLPPIPYIPTPEEEAAEDLEIQRASARGSAGARRKQGFPEEPERVERFHDALDRGEVRVLTAAERGAEWVRKNAASPIGVHALNLRAELTSRDPRQRSTVRAVESATGDVTMIYFDDRGRELSTWRVPGAFFTVSLAESFQRWADEKLGRALQLVR